MKRKRWYYRLAAILLSCFSGTFLLMPLAGRFPQKNAKVVLACVGALFWITGIGGYTLLLLAYRAERRTDGKDERAKRTGIFPVPFRYIRGTDEKQTKQWCQDYCSFVKLTLCRHRSKSDPQ